VRPSPAAANVLGAMPNQTLLLRDEAVIPALLMLAPPARHDPADRPRQGSDGLYSYCVFDAGIPAAKTVSRLPVICKKKGGLPRRIVIEKRLDLFKIEAFLYTFSFSSARPGSRAVQSTGIAARRALRGRWPLHETRRIARHTAILPQTASS